MQSMPKNKLFDTLNMNRDLMIHKLSEILGSVEYLSESLNLSKSSVNKVLKQIRMNTIECMLELANTDDMSDLSPDDQELYEELEEYQCENETLTVGVTADGFHYLK